MSFVTRWILLLAMFTLSLAACATESDKQWYKPGANYTMAEFQRDEAECTKNKVVDEECLKERGWVSITADTYKAPPMQGGPTPQKPRSAPK